MRHCFHSDSSTLCEHLALPGSQAPCPSSSRERVDDCKSSKFGVANAESMLENKSAYVFAVLQCFEFCRGSPAVGLSAVTHSSTKMTNILNLIQLHGHTHPFPSCFFPGHPATCKFVSGGAVISEEMTARSCSCLCSTQDCASLSSASVHALQPGIPCLKAGS